MSDKKMAQQFYTPPPKLGKWEGFKKFIWNGETSECLGRTGGSWGKYGRHHVTTKQFRTTVLNLTTMLSNDSKYSIEDTNTL